MGSDRISVARTGSLNSDTFIFTVGMSTLHLIWLLARFCRHIMLGTVVLLNAFKFRE
jgi:hypothetical protein